MTFTEAAVEVLRREGKPLHFRKITEIAIRENLLDHVGKIPEEVMGGQLANQCRLPRADRRVTVVQGGTFALEEWNLDEDPAGLEGMIEPPPELDLPYRGRERHPIPSREVARGAGRGEGRARRREEHEEKRRRFPPPAEVAFEILAGAERPLALAEIAAQGAERLLMPDAFVRDGAALAAALAEDNRRREQAGRRALFGIEGDVVSLAAQPEPGERVAAAAVARPPATPGEARRAALAALRRRLRECDGATAEWVAARLLEKTGLRELKVAKRGREHVVFTGRRRLGLADVRHCIRVLRTGAEAGRRDVVELRRDIASYGAQIGVLLGAGDAGREARGEAVAAGQLPVLLLCGEALAEALTEASVGCRQVVVPEIDEEFFRGAAEAAAEEEAARRARREERERREEQERRERRERREEGSPAAVAPAADAAAPEAGPADAAAPGAIEAEGAEADDDDDGDEAPEAGEPASEGGQAGAAREGGRRRRRRRRRRGRGGGERREGQGTTPGGGGNEGSPPAEPERPPPTGPGEGGGAGA